MAPVPLLAIVGIVVFLAIVIPCIPALILDMVGYILQARPDDVAGWV